ncbi:hypothetical protein Q3G72_034386 [Acer saccharum]|nr:hypothetical protein Q3G72_034386 [Acer saccharum]
MCRITNLLWRRTPIAAKKLVIYWTMERLQSLRKRVDIDSSVHDLNKSKSPFNAITRSPPAKPVQQLHTTAATALEASAPSGNRTVERNNDHAVKGHSIFIGNLLESATVLQLKEIFEQFGPIKPDGIQVRSQKQKGNCFGFVEFESASAMQSVFQAAPIMIGDRRASIEEKRGNSGCGRGNFIGDRGYKRNDYEKRGNFLGRDQSGSGCNGEANQMVHVGHQSGGGEGAPRQGDMK